MIAICAHSTGRCRRRGLSSRCRSDRRDRQPLCGLVKKKKHQRSKRRPCHLMTPSSAHSTEAASRCRLDAGVGSTGALSGGLLRRRITPGRPRVDGLSCASLHIRACKHTGLAEARRGAEPGLGRRAIVRKERLGAPGRPTSLLSARSAPACAAAARAETAQGVEGQAAEGAPCGTRHVGRAGPVLEA